MTSGRRSAPMIACGIALSTFLLALMLGGAGRAMPETRLLIQHAEALRADIAALEVQAAALEEKARALEADANSARKENSELSASYRDAAMSAGSTALMGPGVEIKLSDASRERIAAEDKVFDINWLLVHDRDVLRVVNALKAAGAEAVAINGVRLTSATAIHCGGPAIYVHDIPLTPPFLITAIGDPEELNAAILGRGNIQPADIYMELTVNGIIFEVRKSGEVRIPAADTAESAISAARR